MAYKHHNLNCRKCVYISLTKINFSLQKNKEKFRVQHYSFSFLFFSSFFQPCFFLVCLISLDTSIGIFKDLWISREVPKRPNKTMIFPPKKQRESTNVSLLSLMSIPSKLLEWIIKKMISETLKRVLIITRNKGGFINSKSCQTKHIFFWMRSQKKAEKSFTWTSARIFFYSCLKQLY